MKKAAIYARCATCYRNSMLQKHNENLDLQINRCKKKAEELGLIVNDNNIYADLGISGLTIERPGFRAMQESIQQGTIDTIIIDRLSRLSRSLYQLSEIFAQLKTDNFRLVSVSEDIDTALKDCKFFFRLNNMLKLSENPRY